MLGSGTTVTVTGELVTRGGHGSYLSGPAYGGGGGGIDISAPTVTVTGTVDVAGGYSAAMSGI